MTTGYNTLSLVSSELSEGFEVGWAAVPASQELVRKVDSLHITKSNTLYFVSPTSEKHSVCLNFPVLSLSIK